MEREIQIEGFGFQKIQWLYGALDLVIVGHHSDCVRYYSAIIWSIDLVDRLSLRQKSGREGRFKNMTKT